MIARPERPLIQLAMSPVRRNASPASIANTQRADEQRRPARRRRSRTSAGCAARDGTRRTACRLGPESRYRRASQTSTIAPTSIVTMPVGISTPAWPPSTARSTTSAASTTRIAGQPGQRQQYAVPHQPGHQRRDQPDEHRRDQPDEADRPGDRHRGRGQQHRDQRDQDPGPAYADAEHRRPCRRRAAGCRAARQHSAATDCQRNDRRHLARPRRDRSAPACRSPTRRCRRSPRANSSISSVVTPASAIATADPARISRVGPAVPPADRRQHQYGGRQPADEGDPAGRQHRQ